MGQYRRRHLLSEDDGDGDGVAVHKVAVAAADAGGTDFDQHFAGFWFVQVNLADFQGLACSPQNGSFLPFYLQNRFLLTAYGCQMCRYCRLPGTPPLDRAPIFSTGRLALRRACRQVHISLKDWWLDAPLAIASTNAAVLRQGLFPYHLTDAKGSFTRPRSWR